MKIRGKIKRIANLLDREYGNKIWKRSGDPTSVLIGTILSQNTTDHNSHRAFKNLKTLFSNWEEVRKSPVSKIERAIRIGGLSKIKAKRIKDILNQIHNDDSDLSLSYLKKWNTDKIISYLGKFKGVGDKTIACVLLFSLGRSIIPVDTHVLRLSKRLELVKVDTDARKAHILLQKSVPEDLVYSLHLNLIQHGRKVCKAQNPGCGECIIYSLCEYKEKKNHIKRGELTYAKGKYLGGGKKDKKALYAPAH